MGPSGRSSTDRETAGSPSGGITTATCIAPVADHGRIVDREGRTPRSIDSLAADEKGRICLVGDWHILPGDKGTMQIEWQTEDRKLKKVQRGQFFAFADVSAEPARPAPTAGAKRLCPPII